MEALAAALPLYTQSALSVGRVIGLQQKISSVIDSDTQVLGGKHLLYLLSCYCRLVFQRYFVSPLKAGHRRDGAILE